MVTVCSEFPAFWKLPLASLSETDMMGDTCGQVMDDVKSGTEVGLSHVTAHASSKSSLGYTRSYHVGYPVASQRAEMASFHIC